MRISDSIEKFILELLKDEESWIELNRKEIADIFHCVPSNINYVMETRFNSSRGFIVESRRGGGGYIRIKRIETEEDISHILDNIGASINSAGAVSVIKYLTERGKISEREMNIMSAAVSDKAITADQPARDYIRASVLKNIITACQK